MRWGTSRTRCRFSSMNRRTALHSLSRSATKLRPSAVTTAAWSVEEHLVQTQVQPTCRSATGDQHTAVVGERQAHDSAPIRSTRAASRHRSSQSGDSSNLSASCRCEFRIAPDMAVRPEKSMPRAGPEVKPRGATSTPRPRHVIDRAAFHPTHLPQEVVQILFAFREVHVLGVHDEQRSRRVVEEIVGVRAIHLGEVLLREARLLRSSPTSDALEQAPPWLPGGR